MRFLRSASGEVLCPGGEVTEWPKVHAWRACVRFAHRGFESHPLRQNHLRPNEHSEICVARVFSEPEAVSDAAMSLRFP
jgi:hypothetical protein